MCALMLPPSNFCVRVLVLIEDVDIQLQTNSNCISHTQSHVHTSTCTHPFIGKVVHFKALISLAVGASLHLHLAIIGGTSALYEPSPVYIPIIHNANTHTQTHRNIQHLGRSGNRRECKYTHRQSQKRTHACQHLHGRTCICIHTHLKENHNGSEALSDHLTSAQHPPINRKTGSAPQGRKQHLENRFLSVEVST